jgi:signal transduction histidine kinase
MPSNHDRSHSTVEAFPEPYRRALTTAEKLLGDDLICHERQAVLDVFLRLCREMTNAESCAVFLKPSPNAKQIVLEATLTDRFGHNFQRGVTLNIGDEPHADFTSYLATLVVPFSKHGNELRSLKWIAGYKPEHLISGRCDSLLSVPLIDSSGQLLGYLKCENKKKPHWDVLQEDGFSELDKDAVGRLASFLVAALLQLREFEALVGDQDNLPGAREFLWSILAAAEVMTGIDCGIAFVLDHGTSTLRGMALLGCDDLSVKPSEFAYSLSDTDIATHVCNKKGLAPYYTPDISKDPIANSWGIERFGIGGPAIAIPMMRDDVIRGSLVFWAKRGTPPSQQHITLLSPLGYIGGTGLSRLFAERNALVNQHNLIQSLQAGLIRKNLEFKFTYCNKVVLDLLQMPFEQVQGKTDFELYDAELAVKYRRDDERVITSGETVVDVEPHRDRAGNVLYVHVVKQPLRDIFGRITGLQTVFLQIRDDMFRKLREAERIAQLGSWDWDLTTDKFSISDQLWRMCELMPDENTSIEDAFLIRVHPEDYDRVKYKMDEIRRNQRPFDIEFRIVRTDGSQRLLMAKAMVQEDGAGLPLRMYGTFQDITETRRAEIHALRSQRLRVLGQLAGEVAHNTLTHFETISLGLDFLEKSVSEAPLRESLNYTRVAFNRAYDILQGLRSLGADSGRGLKEADINEVVKPVVSIFKATWKNKYPIRTILQNKLPKVVLNEDQVKQAITNVLTNAREAMPNGGRVTIITREDPNMRDRLRQGHVDEQERAWDSYVVVEIKDEGHGITEDVLHHIGESGYTTKREQGGTGQGLPYCKKIMDLHFGGIIPRNNTDGHGASFLLVFPCVRG